MQTNKFKRHIFLIRLVYHLASYEYLIKEGVVSPPDPCPVGLFTHVNLHHRFDVVAGQLTGLNDPNTNLKRHTVSMWVKTANSGQCESIRFRPRASQFMQTHILRYKSC